MASQTLGTFFWDTLYIIKCTKNFTTIHIINFINSVDKIDKIFSGSFCLMKYELHRDLEGVLEREQRKMKSAERVGAKKV